ncbi:MT-A70 family methyltransferase [Fulvimarina endophytica]|uniref:MT-A70 family methyltransferase n=1 Tax=Fulvimarina endophytica TaxID=2293836 RepID=UPI0011C04205|nr:MT-A70 family methyltransferase [Fulvimarina endophytica]
MKEVRNQSEALKAYARQAKNKTLEIDASEIRIRAERRIGEIMSEERAKGNLSEGGRRRTTSDEECSSSKPTLADVGIDPYLAHRARQFAAIPNHEFESVMAERRERLEKENERVTNDLYRAATKREARDAKEAELAEKIREGAALLDGPKVYGVILADPPWRFETYSRITGMDRSADNHYPTSSTDDICALPVPAARDAVLFLWATAPMLPDALRVVDAWGFSYRSHLIWNKDRIGTGYWSRNKHEPLLIATRGAIPAPAMGTQSPSVIDARVGPHSAKPDAFHEIIEGYFPNLPKLEMFARRARPGWDRWGAEADPERREAAE